MTFSDGFMDSKMGWIESNVPNEPLLQRYYLEFAILRGLINDNLEVELSAAGGAR
jgi:hypothetical protein